MKIDIDVPDGVSGEYTIESFNVLKNDPSQFISALKTGRCVPEGTYKRLMRGGTCVMSNTPDEIRDFSHFLWRASGHILINGLGLGVLLKGLLLKDDVKSIDVVEISKDVINLVYPTYKKDKRLTVINADAFTWTPPLGSRYDFVWHDIWDDICTGNLKEMAKLHRKYGKRCGYQDSWCKKLCNIS